MSELYIGLSGILAAKSALNASGQNIANASTPGYARREAKLSEPQFASSATLQVGTGVSVDTVVRMKDMFLETLVQTYSGSLSRSEAQSRYFLEIEGMLQEPGAAGISSSIQDFFNQWQAVSLRPEDMTSRNMLLISATSLTQRLQDMRQSLVTMQRDIGLELADIVKQVNDLSGQLAETNALIDQYGSGSDAPLDFMDKRDQLVAQLAELTGATNMTPTDNKASMLLGGFLMVSGPVSTELAAPTSTLGQVTVVTAASSDTEIAITGGQLGGLLELRRELIPAYIQQLDAMAAELARSVNLLHAQGINYSGRFSEIASAAQVQDVNGDGDAGNDLLSAAGLAFAPTAGNLVINITDESAGVTTPVTIAVDPRSQSLNDLADAINAQAGLNAFVADGRLQIHAESNYSFDFAANQGTNILAALEINSFFSGSTAADLRLSPWLADHPERIAAGKSAAPGDGLNAMAIGGLQSATNTGAITIAENWRSFVTDIGAKASANNNSMQSLQGMVNLLYEQEQSVSGVSLDEEAAKVMQYNQMYTACAHYMSAVSKLMDVLLSYV